MLLAQNVVLIKTNKFWIDDQGFSNGYN